MESGVQNKPKQTKKYGKKHSKNPLNFSKNPLDLTNIAHTIMLIEKEKQMSEIEKMRRESTEKNKKQTLQRSEMFLRSFDKLNLDLTKFENKAPIDILKQGLKLNDKMLIRIAVEMGLSNIIRDTTSFQVMDKEVKFSEAFIDKLRKDITRRLTYEEDELTVYEYNDLVDLSEFLSTK